MSPRFAVLPITLVLVAACGSSGDNVAILDSGGPSATLNPQPEFSDAEAAVEAVVSETSEAPAPSSTPTTLVPEPEPEPVVTDPAPAPTFLPEQQEVAAAAATFDLPGCPEAPRGAVADKDAQRYWLCADGVAITDEIPMTTASGNYGLPPVGTYPVFARDFDAYGIGGEALERFVAFYTTPRGNRIAFHEVVNQDPATVGDLDQRGASAGCFRVREDDSIKVWDFLQIDDPVVIIT